MRKTRRVRRVRRNKTKRVRTRKMYGGFGYSASDPYGQYPPWEPPTTTARSWGSFFRPPNKIAVPHPRFHPLDEEEVVIKPKYTLPRNESNVYRGKKKKYNVRKQPSYYTNESPNYEQSSY